MVLLFECHILRLCTKCRCGEMFQNIPKDLFRFWINCSKWFHHFNVQFLPSLPICFIAFIVLPFVLCLHVTMCQSLRWNPRATCRRKIKPFYFLSRQVEDQKQSHGQVQENGQVDQNPVRHKQSQKPIMQTAGTNNEAQHSGRESLKTAA